MDEFERIKTYLAPLTAVPAEKDGLSVSGDAYDLADDAARLRADGRDIVVTKDMIVEGVHFLPSDPLDQVAQKLLRVNLSDLAAKGAVPAGYLLGCAWPRGTQEQAFAQFAKGLGADQLAYGISLLGGDTAVTDGPLVLSLTAFGHVAKDCMLLRSGARGGDVVYVTGDLGGAAAGLALLKSGRQPKGKAELALVDRYRLPRPRCGVGPSLVGVAHSAIDISDGLAADAGHLAGTSCVRLRIEVSKIPFMAGAVDVLEEVEEAISGGDDYEILFTAPAGVAATLGALARSSGVAITAIGTVETGAGVVFEQADGTSLSLSKSGYQHF